MGWALLQQVTIKELKGMPTDLMIEAVYHDNQDCHHTTIITVLRIRERKTINRQILTHINNLFLKNLKQNYKLNLLMSDS